jgi:hypothetical protein
MEIEKPEEPFAKEMFTRRVTGSTVSDIGVDLFLRSKKLPKSEDEKEAGVIPHRA